MPVAVQIGGVGRRAMPEYAEKHIVVDDALIDKCLAKDDVIDVIEPLWEGVKYEYREEMYYRQLRAFSPEQVCLYAVFVYDMEVNSGGHLGFYWNPCGIVWEEAFIGLSKIGAVEHLELMKESVEMMDGKPSKDENGRLEQIRRVNNGGFLHIVHDDDTSNVFFDTSDFTLFDDLDHRFYDLRVKGSLDRAYSAYVKKNREKFYFDGVLTVVDWTSAPTENDELHIL